MVYCCAGTLTIILGMIGCNQARAAAFPRNSIFHLALAQFLFTVTAMSCELGMLTWLPTVQSVPMVFFLQDFFRLHAVVWGIIRVYITLYLVPAKGVASAKSHWNLLFAAAWLIPMCSTLLVPIVFAQTTTMFGCWIQYGFPQLKYQFFLHAVKFAVCSALVYLCWRRRSKTVGGTSTLLFLGGYYPAGY